MTTSIIRASAFLALGLAAIGSAQQTAASWRMRYVRLMLRADPRARTLAGSALLTIDGTAQSGDLVLQQSDSLTVDSAAIGPTRVAFARDPGRITLTQSTLSSCTAITGMRRCQLTVWYHGVPTRRVVGMSPRSDAKRGASFGMPNSAHEWWPSIDEPAQKMDSSDVVMMVPRGLSVVSNGRLVTRSETDSTATFHWSSRSPIYPDIVSFAIGDFVEQRSSFRSITGVDVPIVVYAYPEDTVGADVNLRTLPRILAMYERILGVYPYAHDKYALAEMERPSFREGQTLSHVGPMFMNATHDHEQVIAHEVAHQWFGNSLTVMSWHDIWLNESFAEYMAWKWIASSRGAAALDSNVSAVQSAIPPGRISAADSGGMQTMFGGLTFSKGPAVLQMLEDLVGPDVMNKCLGDYVRTHAHKFASLEDFRSGCEQVSHRPLRAFFEQWIDRGETPSVSYEWKAVSNSSLDVRVRQTTPGAPFEFVVFAHIVDNNGRARDQRLVISKLDQSFSLKVSAPASVELRAGHALVTIVK